MLQNKRFFYSTKICCAKYCTHMFFYSLLFILFFVNAAGTQTLDELIKMPLDELIKINLKVASSRGRCDFQNPIYCVGYRSQHDTKL